MFGRRGKEAKLQERELLRCSFCNKSQRGVKKLIAGPRLPKGGPNVYICDECVDICLDIIREDRILATEEPAVTPVSVDPRTSIKKLDRLMGSWSVTELRNGSRRPAGIARISLGPGGLSLIAEYRSAGPEGKLSGYGIVSPNRYRNEYWAYWGGSLQPELLFARGLWEGERLILRGEERTIRRTRDMKLTISDMGSTSLAFQLETSINGRPFRSIMVRRFDRIRDLEE